MNNPRTEVRTHVLVRQRLQPLLLGDASCRDVAALQDPEALQSRHSQRVEDHERSFSELEAHGQSTG